MNPQEVFELITTRRSRRKFSDREVTDEMIDMIIKAGQLAPSGNNNQPWRFVVVKDRKTKEKVAACSKYAKVIGSAGVLIPVFIHKPSMYHETKDHQSIGACLENMLLMAHGLGLGAVWIGEILKNAEKVRQLLGLDDNLELMAVLTIGWPEDNPGKPSRKSLEDLVLARF